MNFRDKTPIEIRRILREHSCGNGCVFGGPGGMGTNGACKHARGDADGVRGMLSAIREIRKLVEGGQ